MRIKKFVIYRYLLYRKDRLLSSSSTPMLFYYSFEYWQDDRNNQLVGITSYNWVPIWHCIGTETLRTNKQMCMCVWWSVWRQVLSIAHSGSLNYNGMLKKKHPPEKNKLYQEKQKLKRRRNYLKGRTNLFKKRWNFSKKAVIRSPLPSIRYNWKFYCSERSNMNHFNLRTCDQAPFTEMKSIA